MPGRTKAHGSRARRRVTGLGDGSDSDADESVDAASDGGGGHDEAANEPPVHFDDGDDRFLDDIHTEEDDLDDEQKRRKSAIKQRKKIGLTPVEWRRVFRVAREARYSAPAVCALAVRNVSSVHGSLTGELFKFIIKHNGLTRDELVDMLQDRARKMRKRESAASSSVAATAAEPPTAPSSHWPPQLRAGGERGGAAAATAAAAARGDNVLRYDDVDSVLDFYAAENGWDEKIEKQLAAEDDVERGERHKLDLLNALAKCKVKLAASAVRVAVNEYNQCAKVVGAPPLDVDLAVLEASNQKGASGGSGSGSAAQGGAGGGGNLEPFSLNDCKFDGNSQEWRRFVSARRTCEDARRAAAAATAHAAQFDGLRSEAQAAQTSTVDVKATQPPKPLAAPKQREERIAAAVVRALLTTKPWPKRTPLGACGTALMSDGWAPPVLDYNDEEVLPREAFAHDFNSQTLVLDHVLYILDMHGFIDFTYGIPGHEDKKMEDEALAAAHFDPKEVKHPKAEHQLRLLFVEARRAPPRARVHVRVDVVLAAARIPAFTQYVEDRSGTLAAQLMLVFSAHGIVNKESCIKVAKELYYDLEDGTDSARVAGGEWPTEVPTDQDWENAWEELVTQQYIRPHRFEQLFARPLTVHKKALVEMKEREHKDKTSGEKKRKFKEANKLKILDAVDKQGVSFQVNAREKLLVPREEASVRLIRNPRGGALQEDVIVGAVAASSSAANSTAASSSAARRDRTGGSRLKKRSSTAVAAADDSGDNGVDDNVPLVNAAEATAKTFRDCEFYVEYKGYGEMAESKGGLFTLNHRYYELAIMDKFALEELTRLCQKLREVSTDPLRDHFYFLPLAMEYLMDRSRPAACDARRMLYYQTHDPLVPLEPEKGMLEDDVVNWCNAEGRRRNLFEGIDALEPFSVDTFQNLRCMVSMMRIAVEEFSTEDLHAEAGSVDDGAPIYLYFNRRTWYVESVKRQLDAVICNRYGDKAFRIYRALRIKGKVNQRALADRVLYEQRDTRIALYKMHTAGYVTREEFDKDGGTQPQRNIHVWAVNDMFSARLLQRELAVTASKLHQREAYELSCCDNLIRRALDDIGRRQFGEDKRLTQKVKTTLTAAELAQLSRLRERRLILRQSIADLDVLRLHMEIGAALFEEDYKEFQVSVDMQVHYTKPEKVKKEDRELKRKATRANAALDEEPELAPTGGFRAMLEAAERDRSSKRRRPNPANNGFNDDSDDADQSDDSVVVPDGEGVSEEGDDGAQESSVESVDEEDDA